MKIGFSLGKCLRDIVSGKVAYDDVLVIVSQTSVDTKDRLKGVIDHYLHSSERLLGLDADECHATAHRLYQDGKLHQPRLFGQVSRGIMPDRFVWMDLVPTTVNNHEELKDTWEQYQMMLRIIADKLPENDEYLDALNRSLF